MAAKFVLPLVALLYLGLALWRLQRDGWPPRGATRTYLLVSLAMAAASVWAWHTS
jgi:hypothetical protein